jgi:hexosaminidase
MAHRSAVAALLLAAALPACAPRVTQTPEAPRAPEPIAAPPTPHEASAYAIVPMPARLQPGTGWFVLGPTARIAIADGIDPRIAAAAERFAVEMREATGLPLPVGASPASGSGEIRLAIDPAVPGGEEGYRLRVAPEGVDLSAAAPAGLFYGLQTLRQMAGTEPRDGAWRIPAASIEDAPRFEYRGVHLDVGRHFFPVDFIRKYIDMMSAYKMNTFHWHLTEDQGWRLEIEKYPLLTEVGSCRKETRVGREGRNAGFDGQRYCGFYTQEEAREIVEYARQRFVTVIPEIEMPGHSLAALAAYPDFACTEGPFEVGTRWGVYEEIYCPKEETFAFLEDVLTEVMEIFPSEYIHIGGDEAPKERWEESGLAQEVIRRENLGDEHELQSYFIQRMEKFLNAHGRQIIGWDEILEGGLAPNATVMSWRGEEGGIAAAKEGHDVVMTPNSYLYLDYLQGPPEGEPLGIGGNLPLEKVYSYEPQPAALTAAEAEHILGAQANLWTEYIKTPDHVEYMLFPRLLALSEVVWSPREARSWSSFVERLPEQLDLLEAMDVNYRHPVEVLGAAQ